MTELDVTAQHRFACDFGDITGSNIANAGEPIPYRDTAQHAVWFRFLDAAGSSFPANSTRYTVTGTAGGITFNEPTITLGASAYLAAPFGDITSAYTLHVGINPTVNNAGRNTLMSRLSGGSEVFAIHYDGTTGDVTVDHNGTTATLTGSGLQTTGSTIRVSITWDGTNARLYVAGALTDTAALAVAPPASLDEAAFFATVASGPTYSENPQADVDSLHLWHTALSAPELLVLQNFEGGSDPFVGTIAGAPTGSVAPTAAVRVSPEEGLDFDGVADSITGSTFDAPASFSFGARWRHTSDATARVVAAVGADTNVGALIVKRTDNAYELRVGDGAAFTTIVESTVRNNNEVLAATGRYDAVSGLVQFDIVGSETVRASASATPGSPPSFDVATELDVATTTVAGLSNYDGEIYDVQWFPYLELNDGQVATYTRGFVTRPATTSFTEVVEPLDADMASEPPPGEADPPFLEQLDPAPLATGVAVNATVTGRISDTGDGVDGSTITITINGTIAYSGGSLQNSFTGTVTDLGNGNFDYDLTAPSNFPDLSPLPVRVQASDLSPLVNVLDQTYSFTTVDATAPFVGNQNPAPGATAIPQNNNITFRVDDAASSVVLGSINVTVNEGSGPVSAVSAGVIQSPYDGGASSVTPASNGFDFILDPTGLLAPSATITVSVSAQDTAGNALVSSSYSFTTGDQSAPSVTPVDPLGAATGISPLTNVVFDVTDLGTGIDLSTLTVTMSGNPAITAGVFQTGYNGPNSGTAAITNGFRVTIDPTTPFTDFTFIDVNVQVDDLTGNSANVSYGFTTGQAGTISTPIIVENKGGGPISLRGTVPPNTYIVTVTGTGLATDPEVYNGNPGSGGRQVVITDIGGGETNATFDVYFPVLPIGSGYTLTFTPVSGGTAVVTPATVTVVAESFDSRTQTLRRLLPPWLRAGIRRILDNVFPQS